MTSARPSEKIAATEREQWADVEIIQGVYSQPRETRANDHDGWLDWPRHGLRAGRQQVFTDAVNAIILAAASFFPFLPPKIPWSSCGFRLAILSSTRGLTQVTRLNVACGWSSNAAVVPVHMRLVSRMETRFSNCDGNGMLHVRWKNTSDKGSEIGSTGL